MGMYVCDACAEKHNLRLTQWTSAAACEICGNLRGDWAPKLATFTNDLTRFDIHVEQQLASRAAEPSTGEGK